MRGDRFFFYIQMLRDFSICETIYSHFGYSVFAGGHFIVNVRVLGRAACESTSTLWGSTGTLSFADLLKINHNPQMRWNDQHNRAASQYLISNISAIFRNR